MALLALPSLAHAQPTASQLQQASDLVKKAIAKSQAGDHALAIDLYKQAYQIIPTPILLSNIGSEYDQTGRSVEALKYFCKYLDADPTGSNASYATAKAKALQIDLGNPVSDDASVCKPPPPPPPPPAKVAATPVAPPPEPGEAPSGGADAHEGADDHPGRTLELTGAAIAAVGAAGVVVGVIYGLKAKSLNDQIDHHAIHDPWPASIDGVPIADWSSQGAAWNRDTYIFAIGGGVALAAGVALLVYGHGQSSPAPADRVSLVPTLSPAGGGVVAVGRF